MGSQLLATMAVVRATADEGRDYLSYFEPFVVDRLKTWPAGEQVTADALAKSLCSEFGFPTVPVNVADLLLRRAERENLVQKINGERYPDVGALATTEALAATRTQMLGEMNALADAVVRYAKDNHSLDWTPEQAASALERLTEEFGVELALAKRDGHWTTDSQDDAALAVVHGFARYAFERDPLPFGYLENMVKGTMLMNALYFEDVRAKVNRLPDLNVYLDTTPLLRALGMAPPEQRDAAREMLTLLGEFGVKAWVFSHTLEEIGGVLDGVAGALRRGRQGIREQAQIGGRNREAIDALVKQGTTPGEIEALISDLESRLREFGVNRKETPPHVEKDQVDESRFDEVLDEVVRYQSAGPRLKDLKSLAAVDRLRGALRPRELGTARALFVTANSGLVRASRRFFVEEDKDSPVGHAMLDLSLTAQLWVRSSNRKPDLPRQLLIADAYAALNPAPELWQRYVSHIVKLRERGEVTDEQVQTLVYHQQAKTVLLQRTNGNAEAVTEATVSEVLEDVEAELRRPAEEVAARATARAELAERQRDELAGKVDDLAARIQKREDDDAASRERRDGWFRKGGIGLGGIAAAATILCLALGWVEGKILGASVAVVGASVASAAIGWGLKRPVLHSVKSTLIFLGAITALWFALYGALPADGSRAAESLTPQRK